MVLTEAIYNNTFVLRKKYIVLYLRNFKRAGRGPKCGKITQLELLPECSELKPLYFCTDSLYLHKRWQRQ